MVVIRPLGESCLFSMIEKRQESSENIGLPCLSSIIVVINGVCQSVFGIKLVWLNHYHYDSILVFTVV